MTAFTSARFCLPLAGLVLAGLPRLARAQAAPPLPSFYTNYSYVAYTVHDNSDTEPPTQVRGVGGSLTLRPGGTYAKRLSIGGSTFQQDGSFTLSGDSIRFAFTDRKGADVQRGTFRFDPATRRLTITLLGYPAGNKGVYELVGPPGPQEPTAPKLRPRGSGRRRY